MKKYVLVIGGFIVLVLLLAGAAFVGGRLLTGQALPGLTSDGLQIMQQGSNGPTQGGNQGQPVQGRGDEVQPAKELPQTDPDASGIFKSRKDNSIFVGTGKVTGIMKRDQSGNVESSTSNDGPTVEVVVTAQTKVYSDVTAKQFNGPPPSGQKIQQILEPGKLDEINQNTMIAAWGRKTGDCFIADVLLYTVPFAITK